MGTGSGAGGSVVPHGSDNAPAVPTCPRGSRDDPRVGGTAWAPQSLQTPRGGHLHLTPRGSPALGGKRLLRGSSNGFAGQGFEMLHQHRRSRVRSPPGVGDTGSRSFLSPSGHPLPAPPSIHPDPCGHPDVPWATLAGDIPGKFCVLRDGPSAPWAPCLGWGTHWGTLHGGGSGMSVPGLGEQWGNHPWVHGGCRGLGGRSAPLLCSHPSNSSNFQPGCISKHFIPPTPLRPR